MIRLKKYSLIGIFLGVLLLITGCSAKTLSESEVKKSIPQEVFSVEMYDEMLEAEKIQVEIVKRQTNVQEKIDIIWCKILLYNKNYEYTKYMKFTYGYYDKGGWQLDDQEEYQAAEFVVKAAPLKEDEIRSSIPLDIFTVEINGKLLHYEDVKIELNDRETNESEGIDKVWYKITLSDDIYEFVYYVELSYRYYAQSGWKVENWRHYKEYEYEVKANPLLTEDVVKYVEENINQKKIACDNLECLDSVWDAQNKTVKYIFELQEIHTYCTLSRKITCSYVFDGHNWSADINFGTYEKKWHISKAHYRYKDEGLEVVAGIYGEYDETQKVINAYLYYRNTKIGTAESFEIEDYPVEISDIGTHFQVKFREDILDDFIMCFSYDEVYFQHFGWANNKKAKVIAYID